MGRKTRCQKLGHALLLLTCWFHWLCGSLYQHIREKHFVHTLDLSQSPRLRLNTFEHLCKQSLSPKHRVLSLFVFHKHMLCIQIHKITSFAVTNGVITAIATKPHGHPCLSLALKWLPQTKPVLTHATIFPLFPKRTVDVNLWMCLCCCKMEWNGAFLLWSLYIMYLK